LLILGKFSLFTELFTDVNNYINNN
jgi:hypothetical protein